MYNMVYEIQIGKFKVANLLSFEIRKSANRLSDTATIKMAGMVYGAALEIESKIKRGDKVVIKAGYNDVLEKEFSGYVSSITTDNTISIECEDSMFLMKKEVKSKQYKKQKATEIIQDIIFQIGGFTLVKGKGVERVLFDKFTASNYTAYDVLKKIKETNRLHIFVKGTELHVHLKFTYKTNVVKYDFSKNVEKSNLSYVKEEDKKVLVEVIGIDRNHKKTTVIVGDKGGDKIQINRYNVSNEDALRVIGEEEIKDHRFTGFQGDITTWLIPYVTYGDSANIYDEDYPSREGRYYVEAVDVFFNQNGGSRKVTLGIKVA